MMPSERDVPGRDLDDDEIRLTTIFPSSSLAWQHMPVHDSDPVISPSESARLVRMSVLRAFTVFVTCAASLLLVLWLSLPQLSEQDRAQLWVPTSFEKLHQVVNIMTKYSQAHYARVMVAWVSLFLFLQAFSIPGSMYMQMLAGALWGVSVAVPMVCLGISTGASLCYLLSSSLGGVFHLLPTWQRRLNMWRSVLVQQEANLWSYLTVLRMMPVPPHFMVNLLAPHLGIPLRTFWLSTLSGVFCSSLVYTGIGAELEQMAGAESVVLFTWKNLLLMMTVAAAAVLPTALRGRVTPLDDDEGPGPIHLPTSNSQDTPSISSRVRSYVFPLWRLFGRLQREGAEVVAP